MRTRYTSLVVVSIIALLGCSRQEEQDFNPLKGEIVFHARLEVNSDTKTVLQENGTSIFWSPDDKINVFYGNSLSGEFTSTNTTPSSLTIFTGTLHLKDGAVTDGPAADYWAVYPYSEGNSCDGTSVTLTVPSVQTATEGTFANNLFPSIARSKDSNLSFFNVCGGVCFSVENEGIKYVIFRGNADEPLAGSVTVAFDDGAHPQLKSIDDGEKEIRLDAPGGGTFKVGKWYYLVSLPTTLSAGYTMTFYKDEPVAQRITDSAISIQRATFGRLAGADNTGSVAQPDNEIWYTSSDGKIIDPQYIYSATVVSNTYQNGKGILVFDRSLDTVDGGSFMNATRLTSVSIPSGVTRIGWCAFQNCSNLAQVNFPKGLKWIEVNAFEQCNSLVSVDLPNSVISIESVAFTRCSSLKDVHLPDNITSLGYNAFGWCPSLTSLYIPKSLASFNAAFEGCENLASFTGPNVTPDGRGVIIDGALSAFAPAGLTSYSVPEGVTAIMGAFSSCSKLTSIELPEGLMKIGSKAFTGTGISSMHIPESVTSIAPAFEGCKLLEVFTGKYASADGRCLIDNETMVAFAPAGLTSYSVPEGVTSIKSAFTGTAIVSVSLPESLTSIGNNAFSYCELLTSIDIPSGVTSVGDYAFYGCSGLTSLFIPSGVTEVGCYTIGNCPALQSLTLLPTTPPKTNYFPLVGNNYNYSPEVSFPIYVPAQSVQAYKQDPIWIAYAKNIMSIPSENMIVFADADFKAYCIENYDFDGDGEISKEEAKDVTQIYVNTDNIESLGGIEYFTNLTELYAIGSTAKYGLADGGWFGYGVNPTDLPDPAPGKSISTGRLSKIDVSHFPSLKNLNLWGNSGITELNLDNCPLLVNLSCDFCSITELDLSNNTRLLDVSCTATQLTSLDISKNEGLFSLYASYNQLSSLSLENDLRIKYLECSYNQLTSLDVSNCTKLESLRCYNNQLTSLDVSSNTVLTELNCNENQLATLDVSSNPLLETLRCYSDKPLELWLKAGQSIATLVYNTYLTTIKYRGIDDVQ